MNNDTQLIWEKRQRQTILLENSDLVWQAIEESLQMIEEAAITPDMVNQINQQIGTSLTIDQLNQIQTITNPGLAKSAGGALGKLGGFLKNAGGAALGAAAKGGAALGKAALGAGKAAVQKVGDVATQQINDPGSMLNRGIDKGAELGQKAAGAVVQGVKNAGQAAGQAVGDLAQGAAQGYADQQDPEERDPTTGRFTKGNQSGVQFAERNILKRPGWANKELN